MNLVILFPKERSILYLKMNIFLIQIKEVCDRINPLSAPQKKGETNFEDWIIKVMLKT
jgi:hypothetical protein